MNPMNESEQAQVDGLLAALFIFAVVMSVLAVVALPDLILWLEAK